MSSSLIGATGYGGPSGSLSKPKNIAGYKQVQLPTMQPGQYQLFNQLLSGTGRGVSGGLDLLGGMASGQDESFQGLEAPYFRTLQRAGGELGSRFSGMGMGARGSSGFQNALAEEAGGLSERLGSQRLSLQQNALQQLLQLSEALLGTRTHETLLTPKKQSWWQKLTGASAPIAGMALGGAFGGPGGAALGGRIGSQFSSSFLD